MRPDVSRGIDCYPDADFAGLNGQEDIRTHTVHAAALGTLSLHLDALSCMALQTSDRNSSSTMEVEYVAFSTQRARTVKGMIFFQLTPFHHSSLL